MENLGKFIDDIRKEIKWLNVSFEEVPFGESMSITIPPSSKKYIVDTRKIGKIEYDTPMYSELLEMTIEHLKRFNESDENLNISDVSGSKKYVYKYNHNGKDLFYYVDDVEGDMFVSDINDARVFTGKQIKSFELDSAFDIGNEIYCDEEGDYITLTEKPTRIEV